jgi:hypothetical protein
MKSMADLSKDDAFRARLAQSFIPYSKSLSDAWNKPEDRENNQVKWGQLNASAVFALNKQLGYPLTAKGVYLHAAKLRKDIEILLRNDKSYAQPRCRQTDVHLYTLITSCGRYADQFTDALNHIALLPVKDPNCLAEDCYFYMQGSPSDKNQKQMLQIKTFQHYLDQGGRKIRLTSVRYHQWQNEENGHTYRFFDLVNPQEQDVDRIFSIVQESGLNLWRDRSDLDDDSFFEQLSDLIWIYAQTCPLESGSASTTEIIMKLCLIHRFREEAPLFLRPGLSIDLVAMLSTRNDFKKVFRSLLRVNPPEEEEINHSRQVQLSEQATRFRVANALTQRLMHFADQDIDKDLEKVGLFHRPSGLLVLCPCFELETTTESVEVAVKQYDEQYRRNSIK